MLVHKHDAVSLQLLCLQRLSLDWQAVSVMRSGCIVGQALELLRLLLDPDVMDGPAEKNSFLELFYSQHMSRILDILTTGGGTNVVRHCSMHLTVQASLATQHRYDH